MIDEGQTRVEKQNVLLSVYDKCMAVRHHYDALSWAIGGVLLLFVAALLAYIPQIESLWQRLPVAGFSIALLVLWRAIYERNRFWVEVANETMRDIEHELKLGDKGIGIRISVAHSERRIVLKNLGPDGKPLRPEHVEKLPRLPMHAVIHATFWVLIAIILLGSFFVPSGVHEHRPDRSHFNGSPHP